MKQGESLMWAMNHTWKKNVNGYFPIVCPLIKAADAHFNRMGKGFNSVSEQSKPGANTSTSLRYLRLLSCPPMTNPENTKCIQNVWNCYLPILWVQFQL